MANVRDEALTWLRSRQEGVPVVLQTAMFDAVERVGDNHVSPDALLRAAADLLLSKTMTATEPTDPVILLAADALITYVCEYCSEFQPDSLDTLQ